MQTFLTSDNPKETAKILDNKRLGKQRVEAVQILNVLLGFSKSKGWQHHPAVLMWKGYESYLAKVYLFSMMKEWDFRGYKNTKCYEHYLKFCEVLKDKEIIEPYWFGERFFTAHKSNLIRKNKDHYKKYFRNLTDDLEYYWPNTIRD